MQRAFIVTGVLSLGTVLVFGAAMLASVMFPNGGTVASGWNTWGGGFVRDIAVPVPAPAVEPGVIIEEKGVVVGDGDDVVVNDTP